VELVEEEEEEVL
jgi:hypothetical protein